MIKRYIKRGHGDYCLLCGYARGIIGMRFFPFIKKGVCAGCWKKYDS